MTLDRTGEPVDDTDIRPPHDPRCRNGWLGEDIDGRVIPCLRCRPHLRKTSTVNDHSLWR
ncbi:hypothetical protein [Prescottella agglutinans]|uniref:hypothetical protein n=1 Tax=Prescottella agglutinans TaxID=1644129 RepID=UPI003D969F10